MNAWLTEDGRKAIEVMQLPTWMSALAEKCGVALYRDSGRDWLGHKGCNVLTVCGKNQVQSIVNIMESGDIELMYLGEGDDGLEWVWAESAKEFDSYDAALIAAVLAVGGGK